MAATELHWVTNPTDDFVVFGGGDRVVALFFVFHLPPGIAQQTR
jgi:hypothetical protein